MAIKRLVFFFFIFDFKKLIPHPLIELAWLYNVNNTTLGYAIFKYLTITEHHFLKIHNRKFLGYRKDTFKYTYTGYLPYWIDSFDDEVKIDSKTFKKTLGTIYSHNSSNLKAYFFFDKKGYERFFIGKLSGYGDKWELRITLRIL